MKKKIIMILVLIFIITIAIIGFIFVKNNNNKLSNNEIKSNEVKGNEIINNDKNSITENDEVATQENKLDIKLSIANTWSDGIKEYAVNQKNSLLCPSKDSDALCNAMLSLINDNERRIAIAKEGSKDIEKLNWDRAVKDFIGTLSSI